MDQSIDRLLQMEWMLSFFLRIVSLCCCCVVFVVVVVAAVVVVLAVAIDDTLTNALTIT